MPLSTVLLILLSALIHAGWNLIIRARNQSHDLLRVPVIIAVVGLGPVLWLEWHGVAWPPAVWGFVLISALFQSLYYLGLSMGYQQGEFTVVYPLVRALPVLFIALFDLLRGNEPTLGAWIGMILVSVGCLLIPHRSFRTVRFATYQNRTLLWVIVAAFGTVGYSAMDKLAAEIMPPGGDMAARYFVLELAFTILPVAALLYLLRQPVVWSTWRADWGWPALAALGTFGSYWLILWAFQRNPQASYIVAMRQFSIVIGTVAGTFLFQEPARGIRIPAALLITAGVIAIALA